MRVVDRMFAVAGVPLLIAASIGSASAAGDPVKAGRSLPNARPAMPRIGAIEQGRGLFAAPRCLSLECRTSSNEAI
jgi:hypothetical protein